MKIRFSQLQLDIAGEIEITLDAENDFIDNHFDNIEFPDIEIKQDLSDSEEEENWIFP